LAKTFKTIWIMKNWKTTLAGFVPGLLLAGKALLDAYAAGYFDGVSGTQLIVAISLFLIGWYAKDKNVTGGTTSQSILGTDRPNDRP